MDTINNLNGKHDEKLEELQAQLDAALRLIKKNKAGSSANGERKVEDNETDNIMYEDKESEKNDDGMSTQDEKHSVDKDDKSGLSLSYSDNEEPTIIGIRNCTKKKE